MPVTTFFPTAGQVQARDRVLAILSVSNPAAISLATEVNAATTVAIECYLRDFNPSGSEESVDAPDRYCSDQKYPSPGKSTWEAIELNYIWRPSEADTTDNNKAYKTLTKGLGIWLVNRPDYPKSLDFAADQYYNAYKVVLGKQWLTRSGDASDASSEWQVKQMAYIQTEPTEHKKFVA